MLCSAPLIDSHGNVFGVCGLEVSAMLFKLSNMPNNRFYTRLFYTLSPIEEDVIKLDQSMFAGCYSARILSRGQTLSISENKNSFYVYTEKNQRRFLGIHKPVMLYPGGSAFADEQWVVAVMVPEEDIVTSVTRLNLLLIGSLMLLFVVGVMASFVLSRWFLKPINDGLAMIKSTELNAASKTKVPEIDGLIEYLALHNQELYEKARQENISSNILDEFLETPKALSAERSVFDLYQERPYCQGNKRNTVP